MYRQTSHGTFIRHYGKTMIQESLLAWEHEDPILFNLIKKST